MHIPFLEIKQSFIPFLSIFFSVMPRQYYMLLLSKHNAIISSRPDSVALIAPIFPPNTNSLIAIRPQNHPANMWDIVGFQKRGANPFEQMGEKGA